MRTLWILALALTGCLPSTLEGKVGFLLDGATCQSLRVDANGKTSASPATCALRGEWPVQGRSEPATANMYYLNQSGALVSLPPGAGVGPARLWLLEPLEASVRDWEIPLPGAIPERVYSLGEARRRTKMGPGPDLPPWIVFDLRAAGEQRGDLRIQFPPVDTCDTFYDTRIDNCRPAVEGGDCPQAYCSIMHTGVYAVSASPGTHKVSIKASTFKLSNMTIVLEPTDYYAVVELDLRRDRR